MATVTVCTETHTLERTLSTDTLKKYTFILSHRLIFIYWGIRVCGMFQSLCLEYDLVCIHLGIEVNWCLFVEVVVDLGVICFVNGMEKALDNEVYDMRETANVHIWSEWDIVACKNTARYSFDNDIVD